MKRGGFGPDKARIVIVGEAYGSEEEKQRRPFVGGAGKELHSWLRLAGISPNDVYFTNVINKRPFGNDFGQFCLSKKKAQAEYAEWRTVLEMQAPGDWPSTYNWKPVASGKYLHPKHLHEIPNLIQEIKEREPNLIILCGNTPCWAILGQTGISKMRGAVTQTPLGIKAIPMLHPAAILRNYEQRPLSVVDMMKAATEMTFPEISRPSREVWIDPELADFPIFDEKLQSAEYIGCDIETAPASGFIKCVGFSADEHSAIVVPFYDPRQDDGNYWPTEDHEAEAWRWVQRWLSLPQSKIFQNGAYDMSWLWAQMGMYPSEWDDTLLQAHSMQPELQKDLGTLGSIYTNEPAWKLEHRSGNKDAE
jgi:DNA polymerase